MSRRDTIIIAVLLNAGLLIVLFATSLKSDKTEEPAAAVQVLASSQPETKTEVKDVPQIPSHTTTLSASSNSPDQVDQLIKQYVTPQVNNQAAAPATSGENQPNFLADLQAIGTGQSPAIAETQQTPVEEQAQTPSFKEVKVKKGDVLERIARQNHVSVDAIMRASNITSTRLKIGQVLKVPTSGGNSGSIQGSSVAKKTASAPISDEGARYYTVKAGDSPWTIAVKHHMKVEQLLKLNSMSEEKARRLKPGDQIRIQ